MANKSVIGQFQGKCCDASVTNNNDMRLGRQLFEKLFASDEYKNAIEYRHYIGFLGHPEDPGCQDYEHACITMTECHLEDNDDVVGTFDLLDTPVGRIVKTMQDAGIRLGISIRGAGDVSGDGEVDPDTFVFRGFDLVTFPAYEDCIPEFREIAASTDTKKQAKFKKVCASINAELKNITSCEALAVIQEQFDEGSDEFATIQDRINELKDNADIGNEEPEVDPEVVDFMQKKIDGLTDMYLQEHQRATEFQNALIDEQCKSDALRVECSRKLRAYKRIATTQMHDFEESITASNNDLKSQLAALKKTSVKASTDMEKANLTYEHKIEANKKIIASKDARIKELESKLDETVTETSKLSSSLVTANSKLAELQQRIDAAEDIILSYQEAYANMYANALGVSLRDIPVTATTSVKELKDIISAGTSTANIAPRVSTSLDEVDDLDEEFVDDEYTADLITL